MSFNREERDLCSNSTRNTATVRAASRVSQSWKLKNVRAGRVAELALGTNVIWKRSVLISQKLVLIRTVWIPNGVEKL